ncbi:MAG: tRNA adenosine(34) deaminase TadA, partial [Acidobacteriales bacterium]|nr:tRNA adenosine(34) deaminase TadA [Terriglobales bacterium]
AREAGEVPIGAVVVWNEEEIGAGWNRTIRMNDPTAHAEVLALRAAGERMNNYRLSGCEMFATLEPCAMCAGALMHARIARLVYAAADPKAGAAGSVLSVVNHPQLNHRMEIVAGVLEREAAEMLKSFFRERRGKESGAS